MTHITGQIGLWSWTEGSTVAVTSGTRHMRHIAPIVNRKRRRPVRRYTWLLPVLWLFL